MNTEPTTKTENYRKALGEYEDGDYDKSLQTLEQHVLGGTDSEQQSQGNSRMSTELLASSLLLLGNVHATRGEVVECDDRYREAFEVLSIETDNYGAISPHIGQATILVNHSAVLIRRWQVSRHQNALEIATGSEQQRKLGIGLQHPKALIYEALRMLFNAMNIVESTLGVNRIILADCCHNIGVCLEIIQHPVDALEYYMKSLKIRCRIADRSGLLQLSMATTIENVAMIYRLMNRKDSSQNSFLSYAASLMENVIATRRAQLGPLSGGLAEAYFNLGLIELDRRLPKLSRDCFRKSLHIRRTIFGSHHELTKLAEHLVSL